MRHHVSWFRPVQALSRGGLAALLLCAFGAWPAAQAACAPGKQYYRYVGDKTSDTQCTDDDIPSAIKNATCPGTIIVLTSEHTYTAQHLEIDGKSLTLTASAGACGPPGACDGDGCEEPTPTAPLITISGSGHSGDSVLWIHGNSNVTLRYLTISDGNNFRGDTSTYGGGIHFDGTGSLTLDTTTVSNNAAMYGGGIEFSGNGGFAGLKLGPRTLILGNQAAASGGGIRLSGEAYMSALDDHSTIFNNHAPNGYGGGLNVVGPAHADLASPGYAGSGIVSHNTAQYGGGIAITGGDSANEHGEAQLFTVDPQRPVRIDNNFASSSGGGIYLKAYFSVLDRYRNAHLCAFEFRIDGNGAPQGGAIEAEEDGGFDYVWLNRSGNTCHGLPPGSQRCVAGIDCNAISDNVTTDSAGTPTDGAIVHADTADFHAERLQMRANRGGYALRGPGLDLADCLLADGTYSQRLVDGGGLTINNCTFAGNTIQSTDTIHASYSLTLTNSIVHQPGNLVLAYSGDAGNLKAEYMLASEIATLPHNSSVWATDDPGFVDASHGDYHLALSSPAIDIAPGTLENDVDLDGLLRDRDLPGIPNFIGDRDLGAYERQSSSCFSGDTVFCDGFEPL
jgi:hypothetical protein